MECFQIIKQEGLKDSFYYRSWCWQIMEGRGTRAILPFTSSVFSWERLCWDKCCGVETPVCSWARCTYITLTSLGSSLSTLALAHKLARASHLKQSKGRDLPRFMFNQLWRCKFSSEELLFPSSQFIEWSTFVMAASQGCDSAHLLLRDAWSHIANRKRNWRGDCRGGSTKSYRGFLIKINK